MARKKQPGFGTVDFFSGINTPSKKDDKRVRFVARNLGKKSKLPKPKRAKALRSLGGQSGSDPFAIPRGGKQRGTDPFAIPKGSGGGPNPFAAPKELSGGIKTGLLEDGGSKFDRNFGMGDGDLFNSKIGIDPNFGQDKFDVDFSSEFTKGNFTEHPSAMDPVEEDEPAFAEDMEDNFFDEAEEAVPSLLDSLPRIDEGRAALTDEEEDQEQTRRKRRIKDSGFEDVRFKQLQAGGEALTPEEERNFKQGRGFRGQAAAGGGQI